MRALLHDPFVLTIWQRRGTLLDLLPFPTAPGNLTLSVTMTPFARFGSVPAR